MASYPLAFYAAGAKSIAARYYVGRTNQLQPVTAKVKSGYWTLLVPKQAGQATRILVTVTWADGSVETFGPRTVGSSGQTWRVGQTAGAPTGGGSTAGSGSDPGMDEAKGASGDAAGPDADPTMEDDSFGAKVAKVWGIVWKPLAGAGVLGGLVAVAKTYRGKSGSGSRNSGSSCGCGY